MLVQILHSLQKLAKRLEVEMIGSAMTTAMMRTTTLNANLMEGTAAIILNLDGTLIAK